MMRSSQSAPVGFVSSEVEAGPHSGWFKLLMMASDRCKLGLRFIVAVTEIARVFGVTDGTALWRSGR